jgi:tetratricopeptide (TPR) repeat protein
LPKDQQRFALGLAGAAILGAFVVLNQRSPALELKGTVAPIEQRLRARHRSKALGSVRNACRRHDCACVKASARAGLDADAGKEVLALLVRATTCAGSEGMRAEALVRSGAVAEGSALAAEVQKEKHDEPYAGCAVALASFRQGLLPASSAAARESAANGRGDGARFLLGLVSFAEEDYESARRAFDDVLKTEPDDVDALYNLGLVAQKQNRYGEARKRYLAVLRLNPQYKQARFNLGILAHSIGAEAEARHHLEKLKAIDPKEPLVTSLEAALAQPPKDPPRILKLGSPAAAPR